MATTTVFLPKPQHISYGEAMSQVRTWLDYRKVQASAFKLAPGGRTGFELTFSSQDDATLFQSEFTWPSPRTMPGAQGAEGSPSA